MPLFALAAIVGVITVFVQRRFAAGVVVEDYPFSVRAPTVLLSYARYLLKTIWPADLAVFYPLHHGPTWHFVAAVLLLIAITVVAVKNRRQRPYLIVGWLWYLATLAPTIDIVKYGGRDLADRYSYIPSIGTAMMVAWTARDVVRDERTRLFTCAVAATVVLAMTFATRAQLRHWRDSVTLFAHAVAVTDDNYLAHYNLGVALADSGRSDEALAHYREAVRIKPDYALAHGNLGKVLAARGQRDEAIVHYEAALRARPDFAEAHNNLAIALEESGRKHEATAHYAEAVRLSPERADGYFNLAAALASEGRLDEAVAQLEAALRIQPDFVEARFALANALVQTGRWAEAVREYRAALRLRPDVAAIRERLAWVLAVADDLRVRDPAAAVSLAEETTRMTGRRDPEPLRTLAVAYAAAGRADDARRTAEEALTLARSAGRQDMVAELADRLARSREGGTSDSHRP